MSMLHKNNLKRLAALGGLSSLVIFGLFTILYQPGTHVGRSGTLLATQAFAADQPAPPTAAGRIAGPSTKPVSQAEDSEETETLGQAQPIFTPDPLTTLAASLKRKERELEDREKALKKKEEYLESIRKETAVNLAKIETLFNQLEQKSAQAKQQREKELAKWKSIYQSMSPEKAGPIIQGMETEFALELLSQMEPKKAAKILGAISPEKAIELSKKIGEKKQ